MSESSFKQYLKNRVKQFIRFGLRFVKRRRSFIFFSQEKTFRKLVVSESQLDDGYIESVLVSCKSAGLLVKEDLISVPLSKGHIKEYHGGLVDRNTGLLINEAIHYDGELSQEFHPRNDIKPENHVNHLLFFGGILYDHFGHVLLDTICRLWAYPLVKKLDPYIYFYVPWNTPRYLEKKNFVYQVFEGFDIPHKKIIFSQQTLLLKKIIIAPQKYGYGLCKSPDPVFVDFLKTFKYQKSLPKKFLKADKLYVSRVNIEYGLGKPIGEKYFENFLKDNGYKIFYPEQYSLKEQLTIYTNAKKIIFCEGSALHACILLPDLKAEIAIISRRKDLKRSANLITDQFVGFKKEFLWINEVGKQYQFGLETWSAIAEVDWYKVSCILAENDFVNEIFLHFNTSNYNEIVEQELKEYVEAIKTRPEFISFLKENHSES